MRKKKLYKYIGQNGIITSHVFLEGIKYLEMYRLFASPGMQITDGERKGTIVDIDIEELDNWYEIPFEEGQ